ncbi:GRAM domain-containing protein 1B [Bagarius yarrelli]|uniref:GRAM domain-containing protein 1B n=1 Tax=Bagarius yarrelli TaxID=175774 RepID=A0A556VW21_BAGYA|nr:GRAM domain-containing protein 1B [Bagarius yarrelli]
MANPIPIPMLNILPPSSENDSWSPSPSPHPHRRRIRDSNGKKRRTRTQNEDNDVRDKVRTRDKRGKETKERSRLSVSGEEEELVEELASNSAPFLLSPSRCSSLSSRRSRWSLRSLLSRDLDWESCSTASNSPRSTPGSSPSLRRRVLGGRASEGEGQNERTGGGGAESSSLPTTSSSSSLLPTLSASTSNYPISSRHFSRNAKITILLKEVTSLTKEKTAKLIPNAIQINTEQEKNLEEGGQDNHTEQTNQVPPVAQVSSLEMTNDEDLPTDPSNSSDTQEESEMESFCGDLRGRLHINTVVRMSVDKLHEMLFSDTNFLQHLFTQRNFTKVEVCKLETLLQSEVSVMCVGETEAVKTPPTLRRRKHAVLKRAEGVVPGGGVTERGGVAKRERKDTGEEC